MNENKRWKEEMAKTGGKEGWNQEWKGRKNEKSGERKGQEKEKQRESKERMRIIVAVVGKMSDKKMRVSHCVLSTGILSFICSFFALYVRVLITFSKYESALNSI